MILASLLALVAPEQPVPIAAPRPLPSWAVRYVSTWRTRYAIDGVEVDFDEMERRFATLVVDEIKVAPDGWRIRWLLLRSKEK